MQYKAKYRNKTKKLNHKNIKDYETFRASVKKAFPDCPADFVVGYFDEDDHIDVQTEDDYETMTDEPKKLTVYVRHSDEDAPSCADILNQSSIIKVRGSESQSGFKEERNILNEIDKEEEKVDVVSQSSQFKKKAEEMKRQAQVKPQVKVEKVQQKKQQIKVQKEAQEKPQKVRKEEQPKKQISPHIKVNSFVHKGIKCSFCKTSDIKGSRWKCLTCIDYDLCHSCYFESKHKTAKEHKKKDHEFVQIQDDSFWKRVNYLHSIKKTFNPEYKIDLNDNTIGEWISEQDITTCSPSFVNVVWRESQSIAKQILAEYDQWSKDNQVA